MSLWSWLGDLLGGSTKTIPPAPPQYTDPSRSGVPQFLPDGSINPLWQFMITGQMPNTFSNTQSSLAGSSNAVTNSLSNTVGSQTSQPYYSPQGQGLVDLVAKNLTTRLSAQPKVSGGEQMGVINSILGDTQAATRGLENSLAERGISGDPMAAAGYGTLARGNLQNVAAYRSAIPSIERQRGTEDISLGSNVIDQLFKGLRTDTSSTTKGKSTTATDFSQFGTSSTEGSGGFGLPPNLQIPNQIHTPGLLDPGNIAKLIALLMGNSRGSTPTPLGTNPANQPNANPGSYIGPSGY